MAMKYEGVLLSGSWQHVLQPGMAIDSHTFRNGCLSRPRASCSWNDVIEFATKLMDKKINTWAERQTDNKRKNPPIFNTLGLIRGVALICGAQGQFKKDCPNKEQQQNRGKSG
ncbi:hypothetical protein Tco_0128178 [Tanacetum coccineum]